MNRMHEIGILEKRIFGYKHTDGMDFTFTHLDNYLSENFFGVKSVDWMLDKMIEELKEVEDAHDQIVGEHMSNKLQEVSIHHFIEEVGDFILATSSVLILNGFDNNVRANVDAVKKYVDDINDLLIGIQDKIVNPDSVFRSNKAKIEEYYSAVKTWEELQLNEITSQNILVNLIKKLYTTNEYTNPDNKNKIIKEVRRMRFAIMNSSIS